MIDIQRIRKAKNISQKSFAAIFGVSQAFISQIEKGKIPTPAEFETKIKEAFPDDDLAAYITNIEEVRAGSVKERLKRFILYKGVTERAFCESVGVSHNYVNSIDAAISPEKLKAISDVYPELNPIWLISGSGKMLLENPDHSYSPLLKIIESQQKTIESLSATVAQLTK